jgi:T-complex protein 1 subunit alpha
MIVDAVTRIKSTNASGKTNYPIKSINILKCHGKQAKESQFIPGFALNCTIASQSMPKLVKNAKIACVDFNLNRTRMKQGVQVVLTDPTKLQAIQDHEAELTKQRIDCIVASGANVILTTKAIDDLALKYLSLAGVVGVRRVTKSDMKLIAKATGATLLLTMANMEGDEEFDPIFLGEAEEFSQINVSDQEMIVIKGCKTSQTASIILRGANSTMLDEMERSVHDAICIVKRVLESNAIVPGGGCVEAAVSVYLRKFAHTLGSRQQLAISQFAEALMVIPKTLCINAALDATELTSKLVAHHYKSQTEEDKKRLALSGLDLKAGKIRNNLDAGVVEPAMSKIKTFQFATEAAISVLRIDDLITLNKDPEKKGHGH